MLIRFLEVDLGISIRLKYGFLLEVYVLSCESALDANVHQ